MNPDLYLFRMDTPLKPLEIVHNGTFLMYINFCDVVVEPKTCDHPLSVEIQLQLEAYFRHELSVFNLPLQPYGTDFEQKVWKELEKIPFGKTYSYKDLALKMGSVTYTRAVGSANGKNPIPIIIPCHRVTGNKGQLTGFSGGLWRKQWLLEHEFNKTHGIQLLF